MMRWRTYTKMIYRIRNLLAQFPRKNTTSRPWKWKRHVDVFVIQWLGLTIFTGMASFIATSNRQICYGQMIRLLRYLTLGLASWDVRSEMMTMTALAKMNLQGLN